MLPLQLLVTALTWHVRTHALAVQVLAILGLADILPADLCVPQQRQCAVPSAGQEPTSYLHRCWVQRCHGRQQAPPGEGVCPS